MPESGRYIVESIGSEAQRFFRDLGIMEGDAIEVPDGFPIMDDPEPGEPATLTRKLHPNVTWFVGDAADNGEMIVLRRVTLETGVAS